MITLLGRRGTRDNTGTIVGTGRVELRPSALVRRLRPGDIAVLDITDLDVITAEAIVARRPAAVLNAAATVSGRYPVFGAMTLVDAGVVLVDRLGPELLAAVADGSRLEVTGGTVRVRGADVASGSRQDQGSVTAAVAAARDGMASQLEAFAASTPLILAAERELLLDGRGLPTLQQSLAGRPVVVVSRGYGCTEELDALRRFIGDRRPVLVGVDGGADALVAAGWRPDLVLGDLDVVSDEALAAAGEVLAHVTRAAAAGDPARLARLGLTPTTVGSSLTSEDTAIWLAYAHGAQRIITVGSHTSLEEFLDRGRAGMASSFLTRLRVGSGVVDARAVADLHRPRVRWRQVVALVVAGLLAVCAALLLTPAGSELANRVLDRAVDGVVGGSVNGTPAGVVGAWPGQLVGGPMTGPVDGAAGGSVGGVSSEVIVASLAGRG